MGIIRNVAGGPEISTPFNTVIIVDQDGVPVSGGAGGTGGLTSAQTVAAVKSALETATTTDQLETYLLADPKFSSDILKDSGGTPFRIVRTDTQGGPAFITYETLDNPPTAYVPAGASTTWSSFSGAQDLEIVTRRYRSRIAVAGAGVTASEQILEQQVTKNVGNNNAVVRTEWYNLSLAPDTPLTTAQVTALSTPDLNTNLEFSGLTSTVESIAPQQVTYDLNGGATGSQGFYKNGALYPTFADAEAATNPITLGAGAGQAVIVPAVSASTPEVDTLFLYTVTGSTAVQVGYVENGIVYPSQADALAGTNALVVGTGAGEIQPAGVSTATSGGGIPVTYALSDGAGGTTATGLFGAWSISDSLIYPNDGTAAIAIGTAVGNATDLTPSAQTQTQAIVETFTYRAIQNNAAAGVVDTQLYRREIWTNSGTQTTIVDRWYDVDAGVLLTPAQVAALDIPNDFDGEPIATTATATDIKSQDYLYLSSTADASGLARAAIARQYIAQDAIGTVTAPFWVDDADVALPADPTQANLVRAEDGFPEPLLVEWDTSDGAAGTQDLGIAGYATPLSNGTFELFEDYLRATLVTQGVASGNAIPASITPRLLAQTSTLAAATLPAQGLAAGQYEEKIQASDYESEATLTAAFAQPAVGASGTVSVSDILGFQINQTVRIWGHDGTAYRHGTYTVTGRGNAATTTTALYTQVAAGAAATISVTSAAGFAVNDFIWMPDGFYGQITGIAANDITATNLGGQYNSQLGANLNANLVLVRVGPGDLTLQRLDVPMSDLQILADGTNTPFVGAIPIGRYITARSMLDRIPLNATKAFIAVAASRALINWTADASNINEIWQYSSDALRWQIGAGPMDDAAQMLGVQMAFNMDHLGDLAVVQFFSPIIGDGLQPYVVTRYTTGGA